MRKSVLFFVALTASANVALAARPVKPLDAINLAGFRGSYMNPGTEATVVINLPANQATWDQLGSPNNVRLTGYDLAALAGFAPGSPIQITGLGVEAVTTGLAPSWQIEAALDLGGVYYSDGAEAPGSGAISTGGIIDLASINVNPIISVNGMSDFEFFELEDDQANSIDGRWDSGTLTLVIEAYTPPPPPPPPVSTVAQLGGSTSAPIAPGAVAWYSFTYDGTGEIALDTGGSILTVNAFGTANDTEIGLYNAAGVLIETNDDTDYANGILSSSLSYADGELAAGTYYLAVTGWNGVFNNGFNATSTSISAGSLLISGLTVVPEPTSLAALGMIGLVVRRRR